MLAAAFSDFMQQVVSGLASGGIYALLALALVIIHRSTGVINFAQGEMATLSTYIAWALIAHHCWSYWPAFVATLAISFVGGVGIHRAVIRPVERGSVLRIVIVTIGLLVAINGFVIWEWSGEPKQLQSPFGTDTYNVGGVILSAHDIGTIAVALGIVFLLWGLFQFTKVGLALRAAAVNPDEARLVGVRVTWMLALGWGLAALLGAVAGMLTAPTVGLDPNMMAPVLIYAFAAAILGGIDSPLGAVVGGLLLGVLLNMLSYLSQYGAFDWFTDEMRLPMALLIILVVLLRAPAGHLRSTGGEARMNPRAQRLIGLVAFGAFVVFVAVLPSFVSDFKAREYSYVAIYLIALLGLNILTGYTGQISLGHGAFMAIGGYTTAILMAGNEQFGGPIAGGMKDLWTLPIAGLVAGLVGLAFGLPALRLSGLYLALATFAIAVAMPSTVKRFEEYTGGGTGIQLFGTPELTGSISNVNVLGRSFTPNDWMYYLAWSIALVMFAVAWLILRGRTGRAFRAVRDSETAAVSSGVSLARYKTLAFGISAAYAGVAGGLFAIASAFVNPDTFPVALSIFLLVGIVVGGLGGLSGLVFGAIFVAFLPLWAQGQDLGSLLPDRIVEETQKPGGPAIVYGVVLILLMFVLPNGVGGLFRRAGQLLSRRRYSPPK